MFHCEEEKEKLLEDSYLVHLLPLLVILKDTADALKESWPFIGLDVFWRCGRVWEVAVHTLVMVGITGITVDHTANEATHLCSPEMPTGNEISIGFFPLMESISFTHLVYISLPVRALAHNFHLILSLS